jgi:hypothetical protein
MAQLGRQPAGQSISRASTYVHANPRGPTYVAIHLDPSNSRCRRAPGREIPIEIYIWPDSRAVRAHCWPATASRAHSRRRRAGCAMPPQRVSWISIKIPAGAKRLDDRHERFVLTDASWGTVMLSSPCTQLFIPPVLTRDQGLKARRIVLVARASRCHETCPAHVLSSMHV